MKRKWILLISIVFAACTSTKENRGADLNVDETMKVAAFTFYADMAYPLSLHSRPITPPGTLTLKGDTLVASLPYFGKAQSIDLTAPGGIVFSTTNFNRDLNRNENGEWTITFQVRNESSASTIILTVYENGKAVADVSSLRRDNIRFRGYIQPIMK